VVEVRPVDEDRHPLYRTLPLHPTNVSRKRAITP
jgi:hypothetical protein